MQVARTVRAVALTCVLAVATAGSTQAADESLAAEGGMGALAAAASLLYGPVKLVYAAGGLLCGGMAWALSGGDSDVMTAVITPAVRGDYVITPEVLRRERDLEFFGRDPRYRETELIAEVY